MENLKQNLKSAKSRIKTLTKSKQIDPIAIGKAVERHNKIQLRIKELKSEHKQIDNKIKQIERENVKAKKITERNHKKAVKKVAKINERFERNKLPKVKKLKPVVVQPTPQYKPKPLPKIPNDIIIFLMI